MDPLIHGVLVHTEARGNFAGPKISLEPTFCCPIFDLRVLDAIRPPDVPVASILQEVIQRFAGHIIFVMRADLLALAGPQPAPANPFGNRLGASDADRLGNAARCQEELAAADYTVSLPG